MTVLAFNNDQDQADRIRAQVLAHEAHDEIVQGRYWERGKGCFIGCIAHSDSASDAAARSAQADKLVELLAAA